MAEHEWLAERFEEDRTHLRGVAYRMLGSPSEADDADSPPRTGPTSPPSAKAKSPRFDLTPRRPTWRCSRDGGGSPRSRR
jgi:hypothetical protein